MKREVKTDKGKKDTKENKSGSTQKREKPLKVDMGFTEFVRRIVRVKPPEKGK